MRERESNKKEKGGKQTNKQKGKAHQSQPRVPFSSSVISQESLISCPQNNVNHTIHFLSTFISIHLPILKHVHSPPYSIREYSSDYTKMKSYKTKDPRGNSGMN